MRMPLHDAGSRQYESLRLVVRGLRRNPAFSLAVIGCLALGFTAQASVLNILSAVILRPLPFPQSGELLQLGLGDGRTANLPVPGGDYLAWTAATRSLQGTASYRVLRATLEQEGDPSELQGAIVSHGLADVLRVQPALGRFLDASDAAAPGERVVLGHRAWSMHFGADVRIVGRTIRLSERSVRVVGVMPPGFDFPQGAEFWLAEPPVTVGPDAYYTIIGRRGAGLSAEAVRADLARVPRTLSASTPPTIAEARATVVPLREFLYGSARPVVLLVFASAMLLLVVGGAGVANLVLARNAGRAPEIALRFALGAPRRRIVAVIVMECTLLALVAGALGLLLSTWVSGYFAHTGPPTLVALPSVAPDWRVVLILLATTLGLGAAIGLGAALRATRADVVALGVARGGMGAGQRTTRSFRHGLVVAQIAMAMLLVTGAGWLATSLARKASLPLGFDEDRVLVATVALPRARYSTPASARRFFDAVRRDLAGMPGVLSVTYGTPPLSGFAMMRSPPPGAAGPTYQIATDAVGPHYFATYRIPIVSGRAIAESDDETAPPVVVVNATAARLIFPDRSAIGETLTAMTVRGQHPRVVGVSADVPQYDAGMQTLPAAFAPLAQTDERPLELALRTTGDASAFVASVRHAVRQHDPRLAIRFSPMEETVRRTLAPNVFTTSLAASFAGLALLVATVGLFGLLSYLVAQRAREMGIRVALGARGSDMALLVLREGVALITAGVALGAILTFALGRVLPSLLADFGSGSTFVLAAAGALVAGVTLVTLLVPALRASKADPVSVLRQG